MKPQYLVAGAATFAVSVVSGFLYAKPVKELSKRADQQEDSSSCAFDRLAGIYDDVIGSEERYMWYGLFRKWLMRQAQVRMRSQHGLATVLALGTYNQLHAGCTASCSAMPTSRTMHCSS